MGTQMGLTAAARTLLIEGGQAAGFESLNGSTDAECSPPSSPPHSRSTHCNAAGGGVGQWTQFHCRAFARCCAFFRAFKNTAAELGCINNRATSAGVRQRAVGAGGGGAPAVGGCCRPSRRPWPQPAQPPPPSRPWSSRPSSSCPSLSPPPPPPPPPPPSVWPPPRPSAPSGRPRAARTGSPSSGRRTGSSSVLAYSCSRDHP